MKVFVLLAVLLGVSLSTEATHLRSMTGTCNVQQIKQEVLEVVQDLETLGTDIENDVTTLITSLAKCETHILKIIPCFNTAIQTGQKTVVTQIQKFMTKETPLLQKVLNEVLQCLNQ